MMRQVYALFFCFAFQVKAPAPIKNTQADEEKSPNRMGDYIDHVYESTVPLSVLSF